MTSDFTVLPPQTATATTRLRVATYNIHKGVRGMGAAKRLEIHNLVLGVEALDADLVFLQEVRLHHTRDAARFDQTILGWPEQGQAEFLAPEGYNSAYRSNAFTKHGEHGNALLSRWPLGDVGHHDVSDHRFEQRGLLYVPVSWNGTTVHAIVAHFGLVHSSRMRQAQRLAEYIATELPPDEPVLVAGDFNDWGERLDVPMAAAGLHAGAVQRQAPAQAADVPVAPAGVLARSHLHARLPLRGHDGAARRRLGANVGSPAVRRRA